MNTDRLPTEQVAEMPIHDVTEKLGTDGLLQRFSYEVSKFSEQEQYQLNQAFLIASTLHSEQNRTREPYINHILRVATRMMSQDHYKITDVDVICAAILHDSVEDQADSKYFGDDKGDRKQIALGKIGEWLNPRVAHYVAGVTNPDFTPGREREEYLEHLEHLVESEDPWIIVIKLADFTDNATGIRYTTEADVDPKTSAKVLKLAPKYIPAVPILKRGLMRPDIPLDAEVIAHISNQLDLTLERLQELAA